MLEIRINDFMMVAPASKTNWPNSLYFKVGDTNVYYSFFWSILCVYLYGNNIRNEWIKETFGPKPIYMWEWDEYAWEARYVNS